MQSLFFYSKYSVQCKKLTTLSEKLTNINYICVDNSKVREYIQKDEKINMQYVPCILILHDGGIVEKFEGENAFRWVKKQLPQAIPTPINQVVKLSPPPPPPQEPKKVVTKPPQRREKKQTKIASLKPENKTVNIKDLAQKMQEERKKSIHNLKKES